ncbi:PfkB domain protein [Pyrolobus fumarii 1A]|uniref:PfkB domain protein n=1 Tax=Pyrolobus fumarii (strain DSM 11204 / 1A) TaxID=694429 RepID=G0EE72_PYRF1|nr:PfkB family carbohydrate kinase [Pyrolobus fumarii]AEM38766.1 PfkB domain protein [Pyrolobus fumarii 1A]
MRIKHLSIGNINIDIYLYVERLPGPDEELPVMEASIGPGGAASNYAVGVARAGHESYLLAHTTRDAEALGILGRLREAGVKLDYVIVHEEGTPGIVVVVVAKGGETVMFKVRGVNALLRGDEISGEFDVVHIASVEPTVVERVTRQVSTRIISYDPGGAVAISNPSEVAKLAGRVTILSLNAREFLHVFGLGVASVSERLDKNWMLIRLGARGSLLVSNGRALHTRVCKLGEPVDTTGAGDAFNAYFNAWIAEGNEVEEALEVASIAAGLKVLKRGAQSIPSREEVEEVWRKGICKGIVRRVTLEEAEQLVRETVGSS